MEFKTFTVEDRDLFLPYYEQVDERSCELTFANTVLWAPHYGVTYAIVNDMLVYRLERGAYSYPLGKGDLKKTIELLMEESQKQGIEFSMCSITPSRFERLEELFPGKFQVEYNRDLADYVYLSEKLSTLAGKKLHGKRNHINRFKENNPDWTYERITEENIPECVAMAQDWRRENECDSDPEKYAEICVTLNYLKYFKQLELFGGVLRANGKVIAFTIGEKVTDDTLVVHIEKAYANIQGAYPMINQQFVSDFGKDFLYINREEDTGSEGLRKAKLSYRPEFLVEKGDITLR